MGMPTPEETELEIAAYLEMEKLLEAMGEAQRAVSAREQELAAARTALDDAVSLFITQAPDKDECIRRSAHVYWEMPEITAITILNALRKREWIVEGSRYRWFPYSGASGLGSRLPPYDTEIQCVDCGTNFIVKTRADLQKLRTAHAKLLRYGLSYDGGEGLHCESCIRLEGKAEAARRAEEERQRLALEAKEAQKRALAKQNRADLKLFREQLSRRSAGAGFESSPGESR